MFIAFVVAEQRLKYDFQKQKKPYKANKPPYHPPIQIFFFLFFKWSLIFILIILSF